MTNTLKPCPFCGMQSDTEDEDTLYPSGTGWREGLFGSGEVLRQYLSRTDWYRWQGTCYEINCSTNYGGCGANISGDSKEEVINKWNRRT